MDQSFKEFIVYLWRAVWVINIIGSQYWENGHCENLQTKIFVDLGGGEA